MVMTYDYRIKPSGRVAAQGFYDQSSFKRDATRKLNHFKQEGLAGEHDWRMGAVMEAESTFQVTYNSGNLEATLRVQRLTAPAGRGHDKLMGVLEVKRGSKTVMLEDTDTYSFRSLQDWVDSVGG